MFQKFIIFWHNLGLKQALGLVFILSLFLAVPLTSIILQREQSIFSLAGNDTPVEPIDEDLIPYPSAPPQIIHVEKFYGRPGDSILIYGENFGDAQKESSVLLNNNPVSKTLVNYWSNNEVEISLPSQTGVYNLSITVNGAVATWWGKVNVYDDFTTTRLVISNDNKLITVPSINYDIVVHSLTGNAMVTGTPSSNIIQTSVPVEYASSDILNIELRQNGVLVPFRVEER